MKFLRCILLFIVAALIYGNVQAQSQQSLANLMSQRDEYYFSLDIQNVSEIQAINDICSVDACNGISVVCYANQTQYENLLAAGYQPHLMTPPSLREEVEMYDPQRGTYEWDSYLSYTDYVSMMEGFPSTAISGRTCTLVDLGTLTTSNHRRLLGVRINNGQPDGKPRFLYSSTMHGDEVTGMILMLRLINELCTSTDTRIVNLVNNLDIFIFPNTNPDGTYYGGNNTVNGARRYNGNGVDLNRHFPDFDDGPHPDGASSYQNEAQWMINLAQQYLFTMGANYHGGAEVVNYPWDTYQPVHPDDAWWKLVSTEYVTNARAVSSSYMTDTYNSGITNGYAWYTINGSRQDYMNYYGQCREVTLECSSNKTPSASQLPNFWNYNHTAMLAYMEQSLKGVHGIVRDANTQQPIEGVSVTVQNHDALGSSVSTHNVGDFHRPIKGGSYTFVFEKDGYCPQFVDVTVTDGQTVNLEVEMTTGSCLSPAFTASATNLSLGQSINFTDNSYGDITSWQWTFEGATPSTSTQHNPTGISYSTAGDYDVTLTIYDAQGNSETLTKSDYIHVSETYNMQNGTYETCSALFYDSGGASANYGNNEDYTMTFTPSSPGAKISVNFLSFNVETAGGGWGGTSVRDYLTIYDGTSTSATQIGQYYGTTSPGTVTATNSSGALTFVFHSNNSTVREGWSATISCTYPDYTITATANPTQGGTITGTGTYTYGETATLQTSANANYTFANWTENGNVVSTASYSFTVTDNRNLVANFTQQIQNYTVSVSANPSNGGNVTGGGTFQQGESCTVIATPNASYTFNNWTENGNVVSTNASYTFTVDGYRSLVAHFTYAPQTYSISVTANPSNGGNITGGGTYLEGLPCTVNASPYTGYDFISWTENGAVVSTEASYTFNVTANRALTANFAIQTFQVSVTVDPSEGGVVTGADTYNYGEQVTVTITPAENYVFDSWTENGAVVTDNPNYTFTVTTNRNLVAHLSHIDGVGEQQHNIAVYPNPVNDLLTVEAFEDIDNLEVYTITGSLIFSQKDCANKVEIHTDDLPAGTYVIRMMTQSTIETRRFVKE